MCICVVLQAVVRDEMEKCELLIFKAKKGQGPDAASPGIKRKDSAGLRGDVPAPAAPCVLQQRTRQ